MDESKLISLLSAAATGDRKTTAFCPAEELIAAYADGTLETVDLAPVERHLADCEACVSRLALAARLAKEDSEPLPESLLAQVRGARQLPPHRALPRRPVFAAAATVAIAAVGALLFIGTVGVTQVDEPRATRSNGVTSIAPKLLAPGAGATVDPAHLIFRWTEVPGSDFYEVRIVTAAGDRVGGRQVEGTQWRADGELTLVPGEEYFVRVDAHLRDTRTVSSIHQAFEVGGR